MLRGKGWLFQEVRIPKNAKTHRGMWPHQNSSFNFASRPANPSGQPMVGQLPQTDGHINPMNQPIHAGTQGTAHQQDYSQQTCMFCPNPPDNWHSCNHRFCCRSCFNSRFYDLQHLVMTNGIETCARCIDNFGV